MSVYRPRKEHLRLIARTHVRYSIRGGAGLVFTFLCLVTGLVIASLFIEPVEALERGAGASTPEILEEAARVGRPAVKWALGASDEQTDYLLFEKPALVSAFLLAMMIALPFLVSLGAFNQYSGDISNRGFRYLLLRTERINIYLGRFVGTYLFVLVVLAILIAIVALYLVLKADFYPAGDVFVWMGQGYLAMAVFALPYVALCGWISSFIDSPFGSLVISNLFIGFYPLLITIAKGFQPAMEYGGYIMPWAYKYWLLHPNLGVVLGAVAVMLGFTALFVFLGARHFQKRDL